MKILKPVLVVVIVGLLGGVVFVYSGVFNVAANEPHSRPFLWLVEKTRERSIAVHAKEINVPQLDDADLISSGGTDYNEMCTGCHLKPGVEDSELRTAMYPQPPDLTKVKRTDPAQTFWIIKHGLKMSGMPAWGATHDDQRIWAMVAFLQQLPRLTPEQYQILTAREEGEEDIHEHSNHSHEGDVGDVSGKDSTSDQGGHSSDPKLPDVMVYKSASCGCCKLWIQHLKAAGFSVTPRDVDDLNAVKQRIGVPASLSSCHTAEVGGYFVEGHVPVKDIERLLRERPAAKGLAVPGMPIGSPGMEQGNREDPYDVLLVQADGRTSVFSHYGK